MSAGWQPPQLWPFLYSEGIRGGMTRRQLRGAYWRSVFRGVRVWHEAPLDVRLRIRAAALLLPAGGAVGGRSAAALHGVDVLRSDGPVEIVVPRDAAMRPRAGVTVRRALLLPDDVVSVDGIPVTTALRTAFDLARLEQLVEGVVCLDAFVRAGLDAGELAEYIGAYSGWRGVRRAAQALQYADGGAESPMESRLRMVLVLAGLPAPAVNQPLYDACGVFLARPDLRIDRVLVEFDGSVHRDAQVFASDARRQNRLVEAGYTVLRYTASDVYRRPQEIVAQTRAALARTHRS